MSKSKFKIVEKHYPVVILAQPSEEKRAALDVFFDRINKDQIGLKTEANKAGARAALAVICMVIDKDKSVVDLRDTFGLSDTFLWLATIPAGCDPKDYASGRDYVFKEVEKILGAKLAAVLTTENLPEEAKE